MINVKAYGAKGDGIADDSVIIQKALDAGERDILIPAGTYKIENTLRVPSHRHIHADANARLIYIPQKPMQLDDFLLTNADPFDLNEDITIEGGIWDGGFGNPYNIKDSNLFEPNGGTGACLNFVGVKNLKLLHIVVANTIAFYIRLGRVRGFLFRDIAFTSEKLSFNQDGLHFSGGCRDGYVENVRALNKGQTNDDLIALNADDHTMRLENRGLLCGPIENITFKGLYCEDCHTLIRMASVSAPIRHIRFENLYAGVRCYALNLDAGRYCRTPFFVEDSAPNGVGNVQDVVIDNMNVFFSDTSNSESCLMVLESHADAFVFRNFQRLMYKDCKPNNPTLFARNLTRQKIMVDDETAELCAKSDTYTLQGQARSIRFDLLKN